MPGDVMEWTRGTAMLDQRDPTALQQLRTGLQLLGVVTRLELRLFRRRRRVLLLLVGLAFLGLTTGGTTRKQPLDAWGTLASNAVLPLLALVLLAGEGLGRDREAKLDAVLLSTPVPAGAYVGGKYLASLIGMLTLSVIFPLAAMLGDRSSDPSTPPLGPLPYLAAWFWLIAIPAVFGAALMLALLTALRNQRVLAGAAVLVLWALPAVAQGRVELLDVSTVQLTISHHLQHLSPSAIGGTPGRGPVGAAHLAQVVARHLPPPLPRVFFANRLLLLILAAGCVGFTAHAAQRAREGR